mmetsp:Transcript_5344/g.6228  ORF Transcript_5344/g.6228 Transcript_5344/m.6228 type:complete len:371 (+) Transcript_5344:242-1354(+)
MNKSFLVAFLCHTLILSLGFRITAEAALACDNKDCCLSCCDKAKAADNSLSRNSCSKGCDGSCGTNKACHLGLGFLEDGSNTKQFNNEDYYCVIESLGSVEGFINPEDIEDPETPNPVPVPTPLPTPEPTGTSTETPTMAPTKVPTGTNTEEPTMAPTKMPTEMPTPFPTVEGTPQPTPVPTDQPTGPPVDPVHSPSPTPAPTEAPTSTPTVRSEYSPITPASPNESSASSGSIAFVSVCAGSAVAFVAALSLILIRRKKRGRRRPSDLPPSNYMFEPADDFSHDLKPARPEKHNDEFALGLLPSAQAVQPDVLVESPKSKTIPSMYEQVEAQLADPSVRAKASRKKPNRYDGLGQPTYIKKKDDVDAWI